MCKGVSTLWILVLSGAETQKGLWALCSTWSAALWGLVKGKAVGSLVSLWEHGWLCATCALCAPLSER